MTHLARFALAGASLATLSLAAVAVGNEVAERAIRTGIAEAGGRAQVSVSSLSGRIEIAGLELGDLRIGRIVARLPGGLVGSALAQTGQSYAIEGISFQNAKFKLDIPSVAVEGATVGKEEWAKLFALDPGLTQRLKGLNVAAIRLPKLDISANIDAGNRFSYRFDNISVEAVTGGKVQRIIVPAGSFSADAPGLKQDGTFKTIEMRGVDLTQAAHVWFDKAAPNEKPVALYDSYKASGMEMLATGDAAMKMDFGTMTAGSFRMRPLRDRSMAEVAAAVIAESEKDRASGKKGPSDIVVATTILRPLIDLLEGIEDDGMAADGMRVAVGDPAKPKATFSIAKMSGSYGSAGVPAGFLMRDMAISAEGYTGKIGEIGISGFSYVPMLRGMIEAVEKGDVQFKSTDPRKLMPKIGSFTFKGFEMEGPDPNAPKGVKPERISVKLGQFALAAKNEVNGIPTDIALVIDNMAMKLPENPSEEGLKSLKALGYSAIDMSARIGARWDEAKKEIVLSDILLGGAGMGSIRLGGTLGNIGRDVFEGDMAMAQVALMGATARNLSLKLENTGLAEKLLAMQARQQGRKPEEIRAELGTTAAMGIPALLGASDDVNALAGAVARFLAKPKSLSIDLTARNAGGVGLPDMMTVGTPADALKLVSVKASAAD